MNVVIYNAINCSSFYSDFGCISIKVILFVRALSLPTKNGREIYKRKTNRICLFFNATNLKWYKIKKNFLRSSFLALQEYWFPSGCLWVWVASTGSVQAPCARTGGRRTSPSACWPSCSLYSSLSSRREWRIVCRKKNLALIQVRKHFINVLTD